jgi:5-methyltetrahydrofolate--homocysteine methyltransferase
MRKDEFIEVAKAGVLVLDGAMGTMIQSYGLTEDDFCGKSAKSKSISDFNPTVLQKGNNDLLCLSCPDVISDIHRKYVAAGADIISTCTFNANSISMRDYATEHLCTAINRAGASLARRVADEAMTMGGRRVLVAGSMGPTNKAASMSPDMNNPALRDVTYDELFAAYCEQIQGLIDGGVDLLLFETVFDTLNLKAGLDAAAEVMQRRGTEIAIMVSLTLSTAGGRSFSGQTLEAFLTSILHSPYIVSVGLNCSFGPADMLPYLKELAAITPTLVTAHPNAGLPNEFGQYAETPERMAQTIAEFLNLKLVNVIGGCCGTTPDHIRLIAALAKQATPHIPARTDSTNTLRVSGLEMLEIKPENNFVSVGERCNVAGSRKFLRLIKEKNYREAVSIARKQVEAGALILDINLDDGMLDTAAEMTNFLNLLASEPEISRVAFMIDSSNREVIAQALKSVQGKAIVNSISLKEGEEHFLADAFMIHRKGAAMVVMAFDEQGQATTFERKTEICSRAYKLLTSNGIPATDIIFDPNILTIATGIEEHDAFGLDFIRATAWIKQNLPGAKVSGGVSNLSFAFRGNNYLREAMHAVFLYHAIKAGMDMAIVNPSTSVTYSDIPDDLRTLLEDVILNRRKSAADDLTDYARKMAEAAEAAKAAGTAATTGKTAVAPSANRTAIPLDKRLADALMHGSEEFLEDDLTEALTIYPSAMSIIDGPLLEGMNHVGELFGEGKMFLPQVVKTARTMNRAVEILRPAIDREKAQSGTTSAGTVIIATVKGDVHDIGKNIVAVVLSCNNYRVVDLGVMVPAAEIIAAARREKADVICLSGLITPSLSEMINVAQEMERAGLSIPLIVGGATTSKLHTALKIAPAYSGPVVHCTDASRNPYLAARLLNPATRKDFVANLNEEYRDIRHDYQAKSAPLLSIEEARKHRATTDYIAPAPASSGKQLIDIPVTDVEEFINWTFFFNAWKLYGQQLTIQCNCPSCRAMAESDVTHQAEILKSDAILLLNRLKADGMSHIRALVDICEAYSEGDDIVIGGNLRFPMLRQQKATDGHCLSLADYIAVAPEKRIGSTNAASDHIGLFAVTAGLNMEALYKEFEGDPYRTLLLQSLCDRLAEASAEWLHRHVRRSIWAYAPEESLTVKDLWQNRHQGIRPAVGYPSIPDQTLMHLIDSHLSLSEIGVTVTENGAMSPTSTVSGFYIANPDAAYFSIGKIADDQRKDYAERRSLPLATINAILPK